LKEVFQAFAFIPQSCDTVYHIAFFCQGGEAEFLKFFQIFFLTRFSWYFPLVHESHFPAFFSVFQRFSAFSALMHIFRHSSCGRSKTKAQTPAAARRSTSETFCEMLSPVPNAEASSVRIISRMKRVMG